MYSLRTIAKQISDWKVLIGFVIVVLGTIVNLVINLINYRVSLASAPVIRRVEAIESEQNIIRQALVDNKADHITLNSKLDTLLFKLIPNYNPSNYGGR